MTEKHSSAGGRIRRSERARHLYTARDAYVTEAEAPLPDEVNDEALYTPNEADAAWANSAEEVLPYGEAGTSYPPNEEYVPLNGYTPNEESPAAVQPEAKITDEADEPEPGPQVDFSAYYRRDVQPEEVAEPAFAPPPKMDAFLFEDDEWREETQEAATPQRNVYRPREATWANTARRTALSPEGLAYQVREEKTAKPKHQQKRHVLRNVLIAVLVLAVVGGTAYLLRDRLSGWMAELIGSPESSEEAFEPLVTPTPVRGYDASPAVQVADGARVAISQISGTVEMEIRAVTDLSVLTRSQRTDGSYDYYLFTAAEGRLLCYFEGLGPNDMFPQEGGGFYVRQQPYLVAPGGSALIRTAGIEDTIGESIRLYPVYNGWAVIEGLESGDVNYISTAGQLLSNLWFARSFPFTGQHSVAYVDTGVTADPEQRYLLYILGSDGTMSRWQACSDTDDVVAAICGMAYMATGELYHLPDTSAPMLSTDHIDAYVDCSALVIRDPQSGKYGLIVNGEQHYDFAYDSIRPVESDISWTETVLSGEGGTCTVHTVTDAAYPQPLSHYFVLERDGQTEYIALSATSTYPIVLEGEL